MTRLESTTPDTPAASLAADQAVAIPIGFDNGHFATGHLMDDIRGRSVRGGAVTLASQAVKFILQFGSTMVLARLLSPGDFGLIAMVTAVTGFVEIFKDAGLSVATIQREHVNHDQVSTLFWINVLLSIVVMFVVIASGPAIAWFYGESRLITITAALATAFIFSGLTVQHQALMRRQMRFKELAIVDILSMAAGIFIAIFMSLQGLGYWSLVGMTIACAAANCVLVWLRCGWRPGAPSLRSGVADMLRFGGGLTGFSFLNYFTRNADSIIIGYALGGPSLGVYSKAYGLLMMPMRQINGPIDSVILPTLSRLRFEPDRYRSAFLRAVSMLSFVGIPIVAFLFVVADEIVYIILGSQWEGAAAVFRCLMPAALLGTINVAPGWLCVSLGRTKVPLIWSAISAPISIVAFLIGAYWGIIGVAVGFSISWCGLFTLFVAMACRHSPVTFLQTAGCLLMPLVAAFFAVFISLLFVQLTADLRFSVLGSVLVNLGIFATVYFSLFAFLPSGRVRLNWLWRDGFKALVAPKSQEI
ncbi:MAG: lipopolysaccharide biosynthesis protein [Candidatus Hydrogenedentes bacterium]|nr:lipopolysaccharide biosynthesis protein [Candidatus Hydrogenedentota bacterium]